MGCIRNYFHFMASEDNTVLQNMIGTFIFYEECALYPQMQIHMKFYGHEYKGCAVHVLPDIGRTLWLLY